MAPSRERKKRRNHFVTPRLVFEGGFEFQWSNQRKRKHESVWRKLFQIAKLDHVNILHVFCAVFGDSVMRVIIIRYLIQKAASLDKKNWFSEELVFNEKTISCLRHIRKCWAEAKRKGIKTILTYHYPSIFGSNESHYMIIVADPIEKVVLEIDSRGENFINKRYKWKQRREEMKGIFGECEWKSFLTTDLQSRHPDDFFCTTWSLVLLKAHLMDARPPIFPHYHFASIVSFWKEIFLALPIVKDLFYYQLYRKTHRFDGGKVKLSNEDYFSILGDLIEKYHKSFYPVGRKSESTMTFVMNDLIMELRGDFINRCLRTRIVVVD